MLVSFISLCVATGLRILSGFLLFVLAARFWGAERFGEFMYIFSVATLVTMLCEYGFSLQILRDVGKSPETAAKRISEFLGAKVWLTGACLTLVLLFGLYKQFSPKVLAVLFLLTLAATANSYSDFFLAGYRALHRCGREAVVTFWGGAVYLTFGAAALFLGGGAVELAGAMLVSRLVGLTVVVWEFSRHLSDKMSFSPSFSQAWRVIVDGSPYGADMAVSTTFSNIDTVLVASTLGYAAAGVYQAGARFYQGASLVAPIFGSLYLPRMALVDTNLKALAKLSRQLNLGMLGVGLVIALGFVMGAPFLRFVYPEASFSVVAEIFPWFGVLIFVRFIAAAQGVSITALGGQKARAWMFSTALVAMTLLAFLLLLSIGIIGMIIALGGAYLFLAAYFGYWISRQGVRYPAPLSVLLIVVMLSCLAWMNGISTRIY